MSASHIGELYVRGSSPLHSVAAHVKLAAAFVFVTSVAVTPRRSLLTFAVAAVLVAFGLAVSGLRPMSVLKRLRILLAFVPVVALLPFIAGGPKIEIAGLALSQLGLWGAWNFSIKAVLGLAVSLIVTASTPISDVLAALAKLRAPRVLIAIAASMIRYLDVVVAETGRTRIAMASRGYSPSWLWQLKPLAYSAGTLFVRSYERSERVHAAMLARGFDGTMPTPPLRAPLRQWFSVVGPSLLMTSLVIAALVS